MKLLKSIWRWVLFCTPRFSTIEVVFEQDEDGKWWPVCEVSGVEPGEHYEKCGYVKIFLWFNQAFSYLEERPLRDFDNRGPRG